MADNLDREAIAQAFAARKEADLHPVANGEPDHLAEIQALSAQIEAEERDRVAQQERTLAAHRPRPGDAGPLPMPQPSLLGELKTSALDNLRAIPAGFNDAFSMGLIPRAAEAFGILKPGDYQRTMEAGPVGAAIGQAGGLLASGGAGLMRPVGEIAGTIARGLRGAGAVGPLGERVVGGALSGGGYAAADAAARGGSSEDIQRAGASGVLIGGGVPMATRMAGIPGEMADASIARAENRGVGKVIDQASYGKVAKTAAQLESGSEKDLENAGKEAILEVAKKQGFGKELVTQSVPRFAETVSAKREEVGAQIGAYVEKAAQFTPGVRLDELLKSLEKARASHAAGSSEYAALTQKMKDLQQTYGASNVVANVPRVPLWEVKDMATKTAAQGYAGVGLAFSDPTASRKLGRQVAWALRQPLYAEIERVAEQNPASVGSPAGFIRARERFGELSALSDLAEAARPKTTTGKEGLFSRLDALKNMGHALEGGIAGSLAHAAGAPHWVTGAIAAVPFARSAAAATDTAIARLINAARAGFPGHMYQAAAEQLGVSPEIATAIWTHYGAPAAGALANQGPGQENLQAQAPEQTR